MLAVVIVLALVIAGLLGGELYARSRADTIVAAAAECVVEDGATASFGVMPPFLVQHMSGHYTNIHIETAGNQIRRRQGHEGQPEHQGCSAGGHRGLQRLDRLAGRQLSWSADGIKQTIQGSIPLVGSFVTGVSTHPSDGTIELEGALGSIIAKPRSSDGGLALQVTELTGLGFTLPREAVQPALDAFTSQLTKNYPLGIKADSVQVTDTGVASQFSTQNASIPKGNDDPCFQRL